jgi:hypothetical protein
MNHRFAPIVMLGALAIAACATDNVVAPDKAIGAPSLAVSASDAGGHYIVLMKGNGIASDFAARVASLGGTVRYAHEGTGFASVTGLTPASASQLAGFSDVSEVQASETVGLAQNVGMAQADVSDLSIGSIESATNPKGAVLFAWQWNMTQIHADAAWAAKKFGSSDVTVAIIDSGLDYDIRELNGLVDLSRSVSFTDDCIPDLGKASCAVSVNKLSDNAIAAKYFPARNNITDFNGHGTNVGEQVSSNAIVFAGVTSKTKLIGVKVLGTNGYGWTDDILAGVLWAADHGADVANMSIGGEFSKSGSGRFVSLINRVFNYARQKNMLVVVAAGNETEDLQHNGNAYKVYCDAAHVLCVSAVGPESFAGSRDVPAFFSNFGRSAVGVAAPGGNAKFDAAGKIVTSAWPWGPDIASWVWSFCSKTVISGYNPATGLPVTPCSSGGRITGYIGTSQASPHAAGLAALLIAENGKGQPQKIKQLIEQSAVSAPTLPATYGRRIDVAAALGL